MFFERLALMFFNIRFVNHLMCKVAVVMLRSLKSMYCYCFFLLFYQFISAQSSIYSSSLRKDIPFQGWELSLFAANCENLTVFRSGLAANILFGVLWVFLKNWPSFGLICMCHHIPVYKHSMFTCALSQSTLLFLMVELSSLTFHTQRMEMVNDA